MKRVLVQKKKMMKLSFKLSKISLNNLSVKPKKKRFETKE